MNKPKTHMVIPDAQIRPGVDTDHVKWIGNYAAEKRPDVIVCLGDWWDMTSLGKFEVGHASAEGRRFSDDLQCGAEAMRSMLEPIKKQRGWNPKLVFTLGNHENRIDREADENPKWKGTIGTGSLGLREAGWRVYQFLDVANIDRIQYAHYFVSGSMGRPVSSAAALLRQRQASAVQGHVQRVDLAVHPSTQYMGLFAGICYQHDEPYLTPQGNNTKRGIWMLHEVHDGTFDPMFVSLGFLKRRYS